MFLGIHEAAHRSPRSMATRSGTPQPPDRARSTMVAVLAAARRQLRGPAQVSFGVASCLIRSRIIAPPLVVAPRATPDFAKDFGRPAIQAEAIPVRLSRRCSCVAGTENRLGYASMLAPGRPSALKTFIELPMGSLLNRGFDRAPRREGDTAM